MSARSRKAAPARARPLKNWIEREEHDKVLRLLASANQLISARETELAEANGEVRSLKHMLESAEGRAAQDAFDIRRLTRSSAALAEIVGNQAACLTGIDRGRARENNRPMAVEANGEARPFSSAANGARHD